MRKTIQKFFLLALLAVFALPMQAQNEGAEAADTVGEKDIPTALFGFFSYNEVLEAMPDMTLLKKKMADQRSQYEAELKRAEEEFNKKYEEFLEGQRQFAPSIYKKRQAELTDLMERNMAFKAEAQKQALARKEELAAETDAKVAQIRTASKSRAELAARTALLRRRRAEIDKTAAALLDYLTGLGDNDYFNALYRLAAKLKGKSGELMLNQRDLQRLPGDFEAKLREAGLDARVSQSTADIPGGFILKSGDIEENMDFSALLNARRDEIEDLINRGLFEQ